MQKNNNVLPFLKWVGGKRQLLPQINKYIPENFETYYEPFIGGGALFFALQPSNGVINDINFELCNCYNVVKNNVDELIEDLANHENTKEYFYKIRDLDRQPCYKDKSNVEKASRILYLNKTCFNGLFRVNNQGQFNVPFGKYKNPKIVNDTLLKSVSEYLNSNNITITNSDFQESMSSAKKGDFVYLDPPYHPISDTSSFTGYSIGGFGINEQHRLYNTFLDLTNKGCNVMLSNSSADFIKNLYSDFNIITVSANRNINSVATGRGKVNEVLVTNYGD